MRRQPKKRPQSLPTAQPTVQSSRACRDGERDISSRAKCYNTGRFARMVPCPQLRNIMEVFLTTCLANRRRPKNWSKPFFTIMIVLLAVTQAAGRSPHKYPTPSALSPNCPPWHDPHLTSNLNALRPASYRLKTSRESSAGIGSE